MGGSCKKVRFASKRDAKNIRAKLADPHLRPYRCPVCPGKPWHLGHLPRGIRRGRVGRGDVYGRGPR